MRYKTSIAECARAALARTHPSFAYQLDAKAAPAGQPNLTHWKDWRAGENEDENGYVIEIAR